MEVSVLQVSIGVNNKSMFNSDKSVSFPSEITQRFRSELMNRGVGGVCKLSFTLVVLNNRIFNPDHESKEFLVSVSI